MATHDVDLDDDTPPSIDPYAVLNLDTTATTDQIKTAYRKAALKHHPDKVSSDSDKSAAHTKFQEIAFAYAILSDERRRKRYDTTGSTEESLDLEDDDFNWTDFFREQFANVVNEEKIEDFSKGYKGSEEEKRDVLKAYGSVKGHMPGLYERVMLSDMLEDEERFRVIIDEAIREGAVQGWPKYVDESEKQQRLRLEKERKRRDDFDRQRAKKAEKDAGSAVGGKGKSKGKNNTDSLAALIQNNQKGRAENFLAGLEAKYAAERGGKKGKRGTPAPDEEDDGPSEEAFAANRKRGKSGGEDAKEGPRKSKRAKKA
ncbi:hypothetical protein LTR62_005212 [Meristemomyces frigidus]|uniref:J domain-containing protein n=1 Tax=Meristemomyces frigidus TaxID=1508187 RepID=A0AAN7TH56_9PEZI|nr:hypothetical protein LTR62_005212 [Meristemomyces frigidus]